MSLDRHSFGDLRRWRRPRDGLYQPSDPSLKRDLDRTEAQYISGRFVGSHGLTAFSNDKLNLFSISFRAHFPSSVNV